MAIKPMPRVRGAQLAAIICDDCLREEVISCGYEGDHKVGFQPSAKQANRAAMRLGWHVAGGKMACQACNAKRRAASAAQMAAAKITQTKEEPMTGKTLEKAIVDLPLRKPTPKQERLIILALEDAYDDQAKRYKGTDTDKTIAADLGDGILFGWVAEIRERLFGPSGGNEEIDAIRAEIDAIRADFENRLSATSKRLDAVVAAVGPKAARAG